MIRLRRRRRPRVPTPRAAGKQTTREQRIEWFEEAAARTPLLAVESEQGRFLVRTADARIGRGVYVKGHYAGNHLPHALDLLERKGWPNVREGALLDIGANIGTVAIPAVHRHRMRRALAFEPHPENVRVLRMNVVYNDLSEAIQVLSCALSDQDGTGRLEIVNPKNFGAHEIAEPGHSRPDLGFVEVSLRTLDSLEADGSISLDDASLAWLDVQGHEPRVLTGAQRLLARRVPVVAEFHPHVLRRNGTLDTMLSIASEYFESYVDLRERTDDPPVGPASELESIVAGLGDRFTDVLLLPPRA